MTQYLLRRLGVLFAGLAAASLLLAFSAGPAAATGNRGHDHDRSSCTCQKHDGSKHGNDDWGDRNKSCRDGKDRRDGDRCCGDRDRSSHDNRWTPEDKCHDNGKHKGYYKHHRHHHHDDGCRRH